VIMGETSEAAAQRWPRAVWIAERLVTLPTHGRLSRRERTELGALLSACSGTGRRTVSSGAGRSWGQQRPKLDQSVFTEKPSQQLEV
jgi:hypothetical protein